MHPLNSNLLLYGDPQYSIEQNISIVAAVHQYIQSTKRFNQLHLLEVQKPYKFPLPHFYNYSCTIHFTLCLIGPPIHVFVHSNMLTLMYTFFAFCHVYMMYFNYALGGLVLS